MFVEQVESSIAANAVFVSLISSKKSMATFEPRHPVWSGRSLWKFFVQLTRRMSLSAVCILVVGSVLTVFARSFWLADIFANLRVQLVLGLLGSLAVTAALEMWCCFFVSLLFAGLHLPWFFSGGGSELPAEFIVGAQSRPLIVTTANVLTANRRYPDIERELLACDADVVAVIEISSGLRDYLAGDFSKLYPYSLVDIQDSGNFGIGLYSKQKFKLAKLVTFNDDSLQSVMATIDYGDLNWCIIATHTFPPIGGAAFTHRNLHLKMLAETVGALHQDDPHVPVIVMGDLNITPWSPIFRQFTGEAGLRRCGSAIGLVPTWYRFPAFPFGLVLDHVLVTDDVFAGPVTISPDVGSDHRFVTVPLQCVSD